METEISDRAENIMGKRRNCSLRAISPFPHNVFYSRLFLMRQNEYLWSKGLIEIFFLLVKFRHINPCTKRHILYYSKLKEFVDDKSLFDENGRTFSKRFENTVRKREIARYEQFHLFSQCFHS